MLPLLFCKKCQPVYLSTKNILWVVSLQKGPFWHTSLKNKHRIIKTLLLKWIISNQQCCLLAHTQTCNNFVHIAISLHVISAPSCLQIRLNGRFPTYFIKINERQSVLPLSKKLFILLLLLLLLLLLWSSSSSSSSQFQVCLIWFFNLVWDIL